MAKAQLLIAVSVLAGMLVSGLGFAEGGQAAILSGIGSIRSMTYSKVAESSPMGIEEWHPS